MKNITLLLVFLVNVIVSNAQVILDETFNYAGNSLTTEPTWTTSSNTGAIGTIGGLTADPLAYGDTNGQYALSGLGKLVTSDYTSGGTDYKTVKSITPVSSGVIYMSLLFKPIYRQKQSQSEIMALSIAGSNGPKVLVGKGTVTSSSFRFATTRASSSNTDYRFAATEYSDTTATFLLVVKYDWTTKTASLFVNPAIASASEPTPDVIDNNSAKDVAAAIDGLRFRVTGSSQARFSVSGVRVSTSWAAAVGKVVPQLTVPTVQAATVLSNSGFTANWTPVANALSYDISIYTGTTLVKTVNAVGQNTSSAIITGLNSGTLYTYKVVAIADKINYSNSNPSSDSPSVTTTGISVPTVAVASNISTSGFTANWTPVANATGYDVLLYLNTTLVGTTTVTGQALANHNFTGLQMGTTYHYKVVAKGNGSGVLDSTPSETITCNTTSQNIASVTTNFAETAVWGNPVPTPQTNLPATGFYPTWMANGFTFNHAVIYAGTQTGTKGESHTNAISFDKLTTANVVFPTVSSVAQIEVHVFSGSDAKLIALEELTGPDTWTPVNALNVTYTTNKLESAIIENVSRSSASTFRVRNAGTTSMNVSQIIVRSTLPTTSELPAPTGIGVATGLVAGGFTASWTPVANATGYVVSVWDYAKPVNKNFVVTGQATNSYNVIGLDSASMCTYKVAAIGDGITYSNSLLSAPSASFAIAAGLLAVQNPGYSNYVSVVGKEIIVSEPADIEVYSLQAYRLVSIKNITKVNTSLPAGLYIVRYTTLDGKINNQKVIIK